MKPEGSDKQSGVLSLITSAFVDSRLVPLIILAALLLGIFSLTATPREEEPQIVVPLIDVFVQMPGADPREIESRVIAPMEKLLWEIPGVEYVYSTALDGHALSVVRFYVGEDTEKSLIKTYAKLYQHLDWIPPGCSMPLLKPRSIDDVPMLTLTFWGQGYDSATLRLIARNVNDAIRSIPGISETALYGTGRRQVRILLKPDALAARGLDPVDVLQSLAAQNQSRQLGTLTTDNYAYPVRFNAFFTTVQDIEQTVVKISEGKPVFVRDIAEVIDGPEEPEGFCLFAAGPAAPIKGIAAEPGRRYPAITLSVAKKKGQNATVLARAVGEKIESLKGFLIPRDVQVTVTRNYGETAQEKSNELIKHLLIAVVAVGILIALFLGVRASAVVMVAVPVTLAITLFIYYFFGYTLNRVTLFALIFCIGILVDDPIVDVENIVRHLSLPAGSDRPLRERIVAAVNEVRSPLILATFTVIAAIMPLAFVGGLMGPYMRPMPIGASLAMLFSMVVAFVITPWTALRLLKHKQSLPHDPPEDRLTHLYRTIMTQLLRRARARWMFLGGVAFLLVLSCSLFFFKAVYVKMLPFDNKSEFQVILDMPEGSTVEHTGRVAEELAAYLLTQPEVTDCQLYVGMAAPFNFNGLIRHYYLRQGQTVADLQVNLISKEHRSSQSHAIVCRVRPALAEIARRYGARIKVAEVPPGPPVLQTLVAEIYGSDYTEQIQLAKKIKSLFSTTPSVVDVDWYMTEPQTEYSLPVQRDKAMLNNVQPERAQAVLNTALHGQPAGLLHNPVAKEDVTIFVRFPRSLRSSLHDLFSLKIRSADNHLVSLGEIARFEERSVPHPVYHKNLRPVVYVTGDMAGAEESPVYGILALNKKLTTLKAPDNNSLQVYYARMPFSEKEWAIKWDGEWHITYEVFRDMGIAFGCVMILIFILVVGWFRSYSVPLLIMVPIPLSLIGIIPAHALTGWFFTATSMIGFIAGAGIVVRNSIILVDFIQQRLAEGASLEKAVVDAGAVRFRPMLLTALSVIVGSLVILFDPIFQGLALSLMAGEVAATLFSRMVVPLLYYLDHRIKQEKRLVL